MTEFFLLVNDQHWLRTLTGVSRYQFRTQKRILPSCVVHITLKRADREYPTNYQVR